MTEPPNHREHEVKFSHDAKQGVPRWVKVSGIVAVVLVVLLVVSRFIGGGHGVGPHFMHFMPSGLIHSPTPSTEQGSRASSGLNFG
jgi:hypothetical protein